MFHGVPALSTVVRLALAFALAAVAIFVWAPQPVPAIGQVAAAYAFGEGSGASAADLSGNGNAGTLTNGPAWSTAGRYGGAVAVDGVDDRVVIADSTSLDLTGSFTLAAWIHPTEAVPSGAILHKAGASGVPFALGLAADGTPFVRLTTSAGTYTLAGDEPVFPDQWTHVAATYSAGTVRLFVNGIKEWSGSKSGNLVATAEALSIGGSAADGFFEGRIDEVRVDAQAMDIEGVLEDMNTPVDPATPLTVGTHTPASAARGVLATPITARFTRSVNAATVTTDTVQLRRDGDLVSASVSYSASTRTVTVTPAASLAFLGNYSVTVLGGATGVKDPSGEELAATVVWSFQTGSDANTARLAYGFVEGAGLTVEDASGNGNIGTLTNGPAWTTAGKYGKALVFDGVNDAVRIADADTQDVTTALTLEAWVYPTGTGSLTKILHKQGFAPDHPYFLALTGGAPYARIRTASGAYSAAGPSALALNAWTHVAATYDGAALRVFVNGVQAASSAASGAVLTSHRPLWLGSGFNADRFAGRVDDVRLYAKALTAAEIVDDMETSVEDITGPTVTSTNPIPDALDISASANITATFSEALAAASVSSATFELRDALGALVPAAVSYDAPTRTAMLDPTSALGVGLVYTATLTGGLTSPRITDVAGNPLATGYSWSFTTSAAPGAPTLVSVSIFPRGMSLSIGGSHQFTATAHYGDGTTGNITPTATWQGVGTSIEMSTSGRASGVAAGDAVVSVVYQAQSAEALVTVYSGEPIPTDPADVAPPLNPTEATRMADSTSFLYSGENPIQRDVAPGTIEARRAAVVRGTVMTRDGQPLSGARVTIAAHPEFGHTLTRLDGRYDMAVNGGGRLTIRFDHPGFLPADRTVDAPWEDYVVALDAGLVPLDTVVTTVDLTAATPIQVARGSTQSDGDGTRQATLLFPQGTTASLVMPDGTTQPLSTVSVRATEYTVGPNGKTAMPAALPTTSGYTYAVELSADEALAAGATSVTFSAPVPFYVENFLNFPVGSIVPAGYYDRLRSRHPQCTAGARDYG